MGNRKIFVSFLGTNNYKLCCYSFSNGKTSNPVRFVQEALIDNLIEDNIVLDKIYIYRTQDSNRINWEDNGQSRITCEEEKFGLGGILRAKSYGNLLAEDQDCMIDEGFEETGIWTIFNKVFGNLEEGDDVYFDITHAFRSIPMFATSLFNFAQFVKKVNLVQVCYGAFEKLGPAFLVEKNILNPSDRIAPIVDLNSIVQLQQLTSIAHEFKSYGKVVSIGNRLKTNGENYVQDLARNLEKFSNYISTCDLKEIESGNFVQQIVGAIKAINKKCPNVEPQNILLSDLKKELSVFKLKGEFENDKAAVGWCMRYDDLLPQAYIFAVESIISELVRRYEESLSKINKVDEDTKKAKQQTRKARREFISSLLSIDSGDWEKENLHGELKENKELAKILWEEPLIHNIRTPYKKLGEYRNQLCHGKNRNPDVDFKSELQRYFSECVNLLS